MSTEKKDFPQVEPQVSDVEPTKADNPKQPTTDKHLQKIVDKLGELTSSLANRLKELEASVKMWRGDQVGGFENVYKEFAKIQSRIDSQEVIDSDLQKQVRALGDITNSQNETIAKALSLAETANNRLDAQSEDALYYPALLNTNAPASLPSDNEPMNLQDALEWLNDNYKADQKAVLFLSTDI